MREKIRESADQRFYAMETFRGVIEWIKVTNPLALFDVGKAGLAGITEDELKQKMRDYVAKSGDVIDKGWALPNLMLEDCIRVLREVTGIAEQKATSESK
jgi:hypothetical protein